MGSKQTDSIFGHSLQPKCLDHLYPTKRRFLIEHQRERGRRNIQHRNRFPLITKQMRLQLELPRAL